VKVTGKAPQVEVARPITWTDSDYNRHDESYYPPVSEEGQTHEGVGI
jgi:hypothetical protein